MLIPKGLRNTIQNAKHVCVLTGSGISAESGIPTFRGGGQSAVWKGMPFEQISSARMIREDLDAVWEWFDYRRGLYKKCQPNPAHYSLAEWQNKVEDFTLVTQNVDGLHGLAGSKDVIELHGSINRSRCGNCGKSFEMSRADVPHRPVSCDSCQTKLRPDVVLFGEMLPDGAFEKAENSARRADVCLIVGTSALVYPAAGLAEIAKYSRAVLVEINPEETPMTDICDFTMRGKAGVIIPLLI